ncbi:MULTISPECIES: hypothetical protein [unclassified Nonomuraea]|uniref:hypothetical protein n=1 Tax=unclassified Nonomuraea TaxID=2593643 RepID=UPI0034114E99
MPEHWRLRGRAATVTSRLGLRTSPDAAFCDDDYADFCWRALWEQESADLSRSRRFEQWRSPVRSLSSTGMLRGMGLTG